MSTEPIDASKRSFLASLLEVILEKLKWDPETDPDELDEDDKVAFEGLRKVRTLFPSFLLLQTMTISMKDLRTFIDAILMVDQDLVTSAVRTLALNTLSAYRNGAAIKWHDAELAVYLVYIFGEINKSEITPASISQS
jgi:exportin-T